MDIGNSGRIWGNDLYKPPPMELMGRGGYRFMNQSFLLRKVEGQSDVQVRWPMSKEAGKVTCTSVRPKVEHSKDIEE